MFDFIYEIHYFDLTRLMAAPLESSKINTFNVQCLYSVNLIASCWQTNGKRIDGVSKNVQT